jgi:uncharacterized membrane protein YjfL (UPF0719 family)
MNKQVALLGLVEILSALSIGIFILTLTYRLVKIYGSKRLGIDEGNLAYNILIASLLFSVGHVVNGVVQPLLDSFRLLSKSDISSLQLILKFLAYGGLYIAIAYILSISISLLGIYVYTYITPLDELKEIRNNNIGVGITVSTIVIILTLFTKDGIILFIESLVPHPNFPTTL